MTNIVATKLREMSNRDTFPAWRELAYTIIDGADEIDRLQFALDTVTPCDDEGCTMSSKKHVCIQDATRKAGTILQRACYSAAKNAGWWIDTETGEDVRTWPDKFFKLWVAAKLMLCVTELAEAMEGHRKGLRDTHLPTRTMLEVELADTVIRACDLAGGLALDLGGAIAEKLAYNAQRADHKIENRIAEGGKSI